MRKHGEGYVIFHRSLIVGELWRHGEIPRLHDDSSLRLFLISFTIHFQEKTRTISDLLIMGSKDGAVRPLTSMSLEVCRCRVNEEYRDSSQLVRRKMIVYSGR